jgi:hypothetical protein
MTENERVASAMKRVDRRVNKLLRKYERMKRLILEQKWTGGEEDRVWLEQFAIGVGMDICPGDFIIGENSIGVDPADNMICADKQISGDEITDESYNSMDYIVSNYLDVFSDPFKVLVSWHRLLKPGSGTLAFTCRNADAFNDERGPLANKNRKALYTPKIVKFYLNRLGFTVKIVELSEGGKSIRVMAKKL